MFIVIKLSVDYLVVFIFVDENINILIDYIGIII